jgi:citrate synthase
LTFDDAAATMRPGGTPLTVETPPAAAPAPTPAPAVSGLEGVVAAATRLSHVDGEAGELTIAGFPLAELAPHASFEEALHLLWHDRLPAAEELAALRRELAAARALPPAVLDLLSAAAGAGAAPMDALRAGLAALDLGEERPVSAIEDRRQAVLLVGATPSIVAAFHRLSCGEEPVAPRPDLDLAASYLHQLGGEEPSADRARALATYLVTVADHGLNASTFTARVIVSTGSDLISAAAGAVGALKGPLHGGAPGPALDTVLEIGTPERAEPVLRAKLAAGERLMGFGHRVYRVRDPRADVLAAAAERFYLAGSGDRALFDLARHVEQVALRLLAEHRPGRRLATNVEFYTALLLHGLGLPTALFTPTFAVGRMAGWTAHALEQRAAGKLIRPAAEYVGERGRRWMAIDER